VSAGKGHGGRGEDRGLSRRWEGAGVLGHSDINKASEQRSWPAMIALLEVGQGFFGVPARALELEQENGQGAK